MEFAGLRHAAAPLSPASVLAPTVTASKIDSLFTDVDGDTQADPGDTLKYTVNINAIGEDATGISFTDTVDPNTTFVPGSLTATPVAVDDSYAALGNVRISVPAPGVLGNDFAGVPSATITAPTSSTNGGDVAVNANGSFTYNPPAGFEGTDTFTYTLTNAAGSNSATVTITVSGMIWFVNNTASCPCDGRLTNPFNTLAAFAAVNNGSGNNPAANDNIFLYESAIDYVGPVTLLNGQRFIGQDATASLSTVTALTPPTYSDPLPATNSGNAVIVNITSAGNSVNVASGNTLRGFTGGNSGTDINGTSFGTLTIADVTLNGTGQALNLTTGTLDTTFDSISSTASTTTGISLTSVGGTLTSPSTTITSPVGIGLSVNTSSASLSFGNTSATLSGATGVSLTTNSGAITFGALNITPVPGQRGLLATDNSMTITSTSGAISTAGAIAVEITRAIGNTPLAVSQTSVSANGDTTGIVLTNTNGSFTVTGDAGSANNSSGGTIQNTTSHGISLSNTMNISLDQMNIQSTGGSGIDGTQVTAFTFTNGTINNSGNGLGESNIAFNGSGTLVGNNISGTLTVTGSILTNAFDSGLDVRGNGGTISHATVTGNTITSSTSTATSKGAGINFVGTGTASTVQSLTRATITGNTVMNFPSNAGIQINYGNVTAIGPLATAGVPGDATNVILIANNPVIRGNSAANRFGTSAIILSANGGNSAQRSRMNFDVSNNPSVGNSLGTAILIGNNGYATMTGIINNNVIVANNTVASSGIGGGNGVVVSNAETPDLELTVTNNNISQVDGNGILLVGRGVTGLAKISIKNNIVATPLTGARPGIRVDAGNAASADDAVCVDISGNTSGGSGGFPGIGMRKQGTNAAINDFGIEGFAGGLCSAAENFIAGLNPGSAASTITACDGVTVGKRAISISGNNYVSCNTAPNLIATTESTESFVYAPSQRAPTISQNEQDILYTTHGKGPGGDDVRKLTQAELLATVQVAIERWREARISAEDLMRLQAVKFEIADLREDQIASATSTSVKIDETAAEYGWYFDLAPMEDSEFDVPVPERELQTTEYSHAFGRMDLLTVVMRELGVTYRQGKKKLPQQLRSLMENTLSPAVRRLPDSRNIQLMRFPARGSAINQPGREKSLVSRASKVSARRRKTGVSKSVSFINAGFNPIAKRDSRQSSRVMHHAPWNRTTAASLSSMLADVMLNIGTLPAGESVTITFNVTVNDPFTGALPQVSNQGTVSGSNFADVLTDDPTVGGTADPTVTPIDLPDVSVAVSPASVAEDGATNLVYTFTRNGSTANALTVNFSIGGTANFGVSPNDYTQMGAATFTPPTGTVTFGAGNSTATVTVDPETDTTVEPDETVVLTVTSGIGYEVGSPSSASGTITNDDTDVSVAVSPASVAEDGATNLVYTFTRVGVTTNSLTVNFSIAVGGNNAVFPVDYSQSGAATFIPPVGTVTFGAGNSTATVTVDPTPDSLVEPDQTVILTVTSGTGYNVGSPSVATGTITNDDAEVSVTVAPSSVTEDGPTNLVYTFTRTGFNLLPVTVNFSVGGTAVFTQPDYAQTGAATYSDTSGTVVFGAGASTATVNIDPVSDTTVESNETVILTVEPGTGYNVGSPNSATGTITNDDTDVTLTVTPASVSEDGATNLVYTFTRNGDTAGALTVNFSIGGTANFGVSPDDYTQTGATSFTPPTGTVTFGAGNSTATVTINPESDTTVEPDETVILTLTSGAGYNVGSPNSATGMITNDDTDVTLAVSPSSVSEDGATNLVYTFTRNGVTASPLTVNFSIGGTANFGASPNDYTQTGATSFTPPTGTVTFGAGNSTATVTIDPETDTTVETDETVILTVTSGAGYNVASPNSATGTITNDDAAVSVAVSPSSVVEDGAANLVYTFTRTGFTANAVTVNFSVGGTASFTEPDYTQTGAATYTNTSGTVNFGPGSSTAMVTIDPTADTTAEPDETVVLTVTAGAGYNVGSPSSATGTITNDDPFVDIVFSSNRDGNFEIYGMLANGTGVLRLTNNSASDLDPALSLDKTKILFTSDRDGNFEIYSMNTNGTGVTRLTNNPAVDDFAAWSPTGAQIVFTSTRDGNWEIYSMNSNGTGVTRLTNNPAIDANPAWSPSGTKIAFTSTRNGNVEIYSMNTNGTGVTRLTNDEDEDAFPSWSPDSTKITFMSTRPGNAEIYSMNANGSGVTRLTNNPAIDAEPAWGTNGKIAFSTTRDGNFEIYSMNSNGTGLLRLTNNSASDVSPHW
jgi:hypothetical protein